MWTDLSSVLSQFTLLTDRQTDSFLIAIPRLYSMQRGKNERNSVGCTPGVDVNQSATEPLFVAPYNVTVNVALSFEDIAYLMGMQSAGDEHAPTTLYR